MLRVKREERQDYGEPQDINDNNEENGQQEGIAH